MDFHQPASEIAVPVASCNVPIIGSKIRHRHRIGSGRYGYVHDGGTFLSKIAENHPLFAFFIGEDVEFSCHGRWKSVVQAFRAEHGWSRENHETCRNLKWKKVGIKWNLELSSSSKKAFNVGKTRIHNQNFKKVVYATIYMSSQSSTTTTTLH